MHAECHGVSAVAESTCSRAAPRCRRRSDAADPTGARDPRRHGFGPYGADYCRYHDIDREHNQRAPHDLGYDDRRGDGAHDDREHDDRDDARRHGHVELTTTTTQAGLSPGGAAVVGAAAASSTEDSDTQWGWIAFGILAAAVIVFGIVWLVRRSRRA